MAEVEFHSVWRRIYINKQLASHIIGYSGRDLIGLSGIEKTIPKSKILHEDIKLSIDISVQFHLEDQIAKGIELYGAESGFGIVMDANNGQIIASASLPTFDPNIINKNYTNGAVKESTFNQVFQGSYELGSVMKIMTLAMGLESSQIDLNDKFDDNICIKIAANRCLNNYRNQSSENLINSGINNTLVQLGEYRGIGDHPDGRPWRLLLSNPEHTDSIGEIEFTNAALATSAGLGTPFDLSGKYHHIFDPKSGYSSNNYLQASVLAKTAAEADALATAFLVLDKKASKKIAEKQKVGFEILDNQRKRNIITSI